MSEMVERAARAMLVAGQERERQRVASWPHASGFYATPWEELAEEVKAEWIANARAAIEAMREPTEAMKAAGYIVTVDDETEVWHTMIDAALLQEIEKPE